MSSEDITDLTDMLKQRGLLAVAAVDDASEAQAKKARTGPYNNPKKTPREIAKLANPALVARWANSVHILEEAVKNGGDGSLFLGNQRPSEGSPPPPPPNPATPVNPAPPANPPGGPVLPKDTVKDTETQSTQSVQNAQMRD